MFTLGDAKNPSHAFHLGEATIHRGLWILGSMLLLEFFGTLLFFRELEINRKLTERVLELELLHRLDQVQAAPRILIKHSDPTEKSPAVPKQPSQLTAQALLSSAESVSLPTAQARISQIEVDCEQENCDIKASLITASPGLASGEIFFVLEGNQVRIGPSFHTSENKIQYLIFPGETIHDNISEAILKTKTGKRFRFSRALDTTASLEFGKSIHPVAVHTYLMSEDKTMMFHLRHPIQEETPNVE